MGEQEEQERGNEMFTSEQWTPRDLRKMSSQRESQSEGERNIGASVDANCPIDSVLFFYIIPRKLIH